MRNLSKIEVNIDKGNINRFKNIMAVLQKNKIPLLDIHFDIKDPPHFSSIKPILYHIINNFESKTSIIFFNLPYCILPDAEEHIINPPSDKKIKGEDCEKCKFNGFCGGFPKNIDFETAPVPDIPREVSIELTNACNLDCKFCFTKSNYDGEHSLEKKQIETIIGQAKYLGIKRIRFTGGEPLLIKDLNSHINYARKSGLTVWLNTNGTLPEKIEKIPIFNIESILIPIHGHKGSIEAKITGRGDSLSRKLESVKRVKFKTRLRIGTIVNEENSKNLLAFYEMIKKFNTSWELYRIMGIEREKLNEPGDFQTLYQNLMKIYEKDGKRIFVVNAFPFCFFENPDNARLFSLGGFLDNGNDRIVIDCTGRARPAYYSRNSTGSWKNLKKAWNGKTMKKLRNLECLPKKCRECNFKSLCKGGSRIMAKNVLGDYRSNDPLLGHR